MVCFSAWCRTTDENTDIHALSTPHIQSLSRNDRLAIICFYFARSTRQACYREAVEATAVMMSTRQYK